MLLIDDTLFTGGNGPGGGPGFQTMGFHTMALSAGLPPFISVSVGIPGSQTMNNTNSTADVDCFSVSTATRWLGVRVTNDASAGGAVLQVDTAGSAIMTELAVYRYIGLSCLQSVPCMHANVMGCDTNSAGGSYSLVKFPAVPGGQYLVFADGLGGELGIINFNWQLGIPPILDITKSNCTLVFPAGTNVTLISGVTNGIPAPGYQWYFCGTPLPNATNSTLSFTPIHSSDAGCYSVVASNFAGVLTNQCCVIVDPAELRFQVDWEAFPPACNISGALLGGAVLQSATSLTPLISWQNVVTNLTTNCNFQYAAPMYDTNGYPIPQCFYQTRRP